MNMMRHDQVFSDVQSKYVFYGHISADHSNNSQAVSMGTDICCKYIVFKPELYRLTSRIYLEFKAGVSMLPGRPQLFTTQEGPVLT